MTTTKQPSLGDLHSRYLAGETLTDGEVAILKGSNVLTFQANGPQRGTVGSTMSGSALQFA